MTGFALEEIWFIYFEDWIGLFVIISETLKYDNKSIVNSIKCNDLFICILFNSCLSNNYIKKADLLLL